jgi:hypothetical protein
MKITAIVLTVLFSMAFCAPVCAETVASEFCNPQKLEECKTKIDNLLESVESLRAKLLKSQAELNAGKQLTDEEADRLLKNIDPLYKVVPTPTTEGFMWDN